MQFRREWLLIAAFMVIAGMVGWKLTRPHQTFQQPELLRGEFIPPGFQLHDSRSHMVRLEAFQGRHPILVVFYVASQGPDNHPLLQSLRDNFKEFSQRGIKTFAISASTPYFNREAFKRGGEFPFPLLSDPTLQAHHLWKAYDSEQNRPRQVVFVIDRRGVGRWYKAEPDLPQDAAPILEQFDSLK